VFRRRRVQALVVTPLYHKWPRGHKAKTECSYRSETCQPDSPRLSWKLRSYVFCFILELILLIMAIKLGSSDSRLSQSNYLARKPNHVASLNHPPSFSTKFLQLPHSIMSQPTSSGAQSAKYGNIVLRGKVVENQDSREGRHGAVDGDVRRDANGRSSACYRSDDRHQLCVSHCLIEL
jgi:hypothetical protein